MERVRGTEKPLATISGTRLISDYTHCTHYNHYNPQYKSHIHDGCVTT